MKKKFILLSLVVSSLVVVSFTHKVRAQGAAHKVEVTASRFSFEPSTITVKKGEQVDLVLKSKDVSHGLRFRDLNVNIKAEKGGSVEVQFTPDKAGDFVGHCSVFCGSGHGSMSLTLHVTE